MDSSPNLPPLPEPPSAVPAAPTEAPTEVSAAEIATIAAARDQIVAQLRKRIVGQDDVIELLLIAVFARGHSLFIGVPGLAKTLLISTLSDAVDLKFNRIQFTPDLMPSDITGTDVLEEDQSTGRRSFTFIPGPLFCNILLADEINRTPPKTQAALLQAMQERRVTASGKTYDLAPPFLVFATQNPIEQEGTYPLPEAQLDRFMFSINVGYPTFEEEVAIVSATTGRAQEDVTAVLDQETLVRAQKMVLQVPALPEVVRAAVNLVSRTRPENPNAPQIVKDFVGWGAGPRASQYLVLGAKARAVLQGRTSASVADIYALASAVLGHRILVNFRGEAERISTDQIIAELIRTGSTTR